MEDPSPPLKVSRAKSTLINEPSGAIFRIPEMSIKLGFLAKCHRYDLHASILVLVGYFEQLRSLLAPLIP